MQIHCTVSSPVLTNAKVCRKTPSESVAVINPLGNTVPMPKLDSCGLLHL